MNYRRVFKEKYGYIPVGWHVHHIDGNDKNNLAENLIALPARQHNLIHAEQIKIQRLFTREELELKVLAWGAKQESLFDTLDEFSKKYQELSELWYSLNGNWIAYDDVAARALKGQPLKTQKRKEKKKKAKQRKKIKRIQWEANYQGKQPRSDFKPFQPKTILFKS